MGLFVCDECDAVENTALSRYWLRRMVPELDGRALCSECDPKTGKWHGKFPKKAWDGDEDRVINRGKPAPRFESAQERHERER